MLYSTYCDTPLDDVMVIVEADSREAAKAKIRAGVALIVGCEASDVEFYNLHDETECPETVLHYQTAWGGPYGVGEMRASGWASNPLLLLPDDARQAALKRWQAAMADKCIYEARKRADSLESEALGVGPRVIF